MACRGPCGKKNEDGTECMLDSGHSGPHDWSFAWRTEQARYLRDRQTHDLDRQIERDGNQYGAMHITMNQLLCSACRTLERMGYDIDENPALSQWWDEHKKKDEMSSNEK